MSIILRCGGRNMSGETGSGMERNLKYMFRNKLLKLKALCRSHLFFLNANAKRIGRNNIKDTEALLKLLNDVSLFGYSKFRMGDAMRTRIQDNDFTSMRDANIFVFWKHYIKFFVFRALFSATENIKYGDGSILFVHSSYGTRADTISWFLEVSKLCYNTIISRCVMFKPAKWKPKLRGLFLVALYPIWVFQYIKVGLPLRFGRLIAMCVYLGIAEYEDIVKDVEWEKIRLVTLFCDLHISDALVMQEAERRRIRTATLQHGMVGVISYRWTNCDFFLGYGQHAKTCFEKSNPLDKTTFLCVGFPKWIGKILPEKRKNRECRNEIGIFLTGVEEEDRLLLEIGFNFAECHDFYVKVRPHPGNPVKYEKEWEERLKHESDIKEPLEIYMESADFFIAGISTTFMECMVRLIPCFHFAGKGDIYDKVEWCSFSSLEGLEKLFDYFKDNQKEYENRVKKTRAYYTETGNIGERYYDFFRDYDI